MILGSEINMKTLDMAYESRNNLDLQMENRAW